jgi:hypothetical protein
MKAWVVEKIAKKRNIRFGGTTVGKWLILIVHAFVRFQYNFFPNTFYHNKREEMVTGPGKQIAAGSRQHSRSWFRGPVDTHDQIYIRSNIV